LIIFEANKKGRVMSFSVQLLFAKAIDNDRTALVIKDNSQLQVGVAYLTYYGWRHTWGPPHPVLQSYSFSEAKLHFRWE
jgi:hypothetical protein